MDWSVGYVGFLVYVFVIITYRFPLAQVAMIAALLALPFQKYRFKVPAFVWFFGAFFFVAAVGFSLTNYRDFTYDALINLFKILLVSLVGLNVLQSRARIRFFLFFYLGCFALYPIRGAILNYFIYGATEQGRVSWNYIFENPNDLAAFVLLPFALCLTMLVTEKDRWIRYCAMAGMALIPLVIFLSQSRGAILALGASAFLLILSTRGYRLRGVVAAAGIVGLLVIFAPASVWTRMGSLFQATEAGQLQNANDSGSAAQRYEIWRVARKIIADYPVLGIGFNAYPNAHSTYARSGTIERTARGARDAHSTYLTLLAETGIAGFLAFSALVIAVVAKAVGALRRLQRVLPGRAKELTFMLYGLLAYGLAAIFGSYVALPFTYLHLCMLWVLAEQGDAEVRQLTHVRHRS